MNVIFLDIDGVLNCDDTPNPRKFPYIVDPRLLSILEGLLVRTGGIVVLSSWRKRPYDAPACSRSLRTEHSFIVQAGQELAMGDEQMRGPFLLQD